MGPCYEPFHAGGFVLWASILNMVFIGVRTKGP